jgi:hypothetical protein
MSTLSGLKRSAARPRGGVTQVNVATAGAIATAAQNSDAFPASIAEAVGASGAAYSFREDGASYSETLAGSPQQPLVRHTLVMEFPAGEESRRAVDELLAYSAGGFVAVVTLASGELLTVGYSMRFRTDYPLRVAALASATGSVPSDFPALVITLESCDANTAFNY